MYPLTLGSLECSLLLALLLSPTIAIHHMQLPPVHWVSKRDSGVPLKVTNKCSEDIYPGIQTQSGTGPPSSGFRLGPGASNSQMVGADWNGRVWARTNCSFNVQGTASVNGAGPACTTGDCGGAVACPSTVSIPKSAVFVTTNNFPQGALPATLAEFNLLAKIGSTFQTFYDISLVDGYNIPIGIVYLGSASGNSNNSDFPPNLTNPVCIGTAALLTDPGDAPDAYLGSNSTSYPLPLEHTVSQSAVQDWCPWDLQLAPPQKPGDGVYPYPDDNIQRPLFNPCYSACTKWNSPQYCCTGKYNSPGSCSPSFYSTQAKMVCPDAYSYAYDDQTSTFGIPSGGGFEVVFCPTGRSTTILKTLGSQLSQLAQAGHVTAQINADTQNVTLIKLKNDGASPRGSQALLAFAMLLAVFYFS
jgi:Thaumatin family